MEAGETDRERQLASAFQVPESCNVVRHGLHHLFLGETALFRPQACSVMEDLRAISSALEEELSSSCKSPSRFNFHFNALSEGLQLARNQDTFAQLVERYLSSDDAATRRAVLAVLAEMITEVDDDKRVRHVCAGHRKLTPARTAVHPRRHLPHVHSPHPPRLERFPRSCQVDHA